MGTQNLEEDDSTLLELTSQQHGVLDILKDKETDKYPLSKWYLDTLYALDNDLNPDRFCKQPIR